MTTATWCLGGSFYAVIAALVAIGMWVPSPGGGRLACAAIGTLWPLLVVMIVVHVAWWEIEILIEAVIRRAR